jgi:hypothetical protein
MEMVTKNIAQGEPLASLDELVRLARESKSVVVESPYYRYIRPAAFMIHWPLVHLVSLKFYYTIKVK